MNKYKEALETMCRRCENHEMCMGTGCEPKRVLGELIERSIPREAFKEETKVAMPSKSLMHWE